jgi:hypothetical protein
LYGRQVERPGRDYFIGVAQGAKSQDPFACSEGAHIGPFSHRPGTHALHALFQQCLQKSVITGRYDIRSQVVESLKVQGIDLAGPDKFMNLDHPAVFGFDAIQFLVIDDYEFPFFQFKSMDLFICRYGHLLIGANHLLPEPDMIPAVQQMKLDSLFPDGRVELHRHIKAFEMNIPFPDCPNCHEHLRLLA